MTKLSPVKLFLKERNANVYITKHKLFGAKVELFGAAYAVNYHGRYLRRDGTLQNPGAAHAELQDRAGTEWRAMAFGDEGIIVGREDSKPLKYISPHFPGNKVATIKNPHKTKKKSALVPVLVIGGALLALYFLNKP